MRRLIKSTTIVLTALACFESPTSNAKASTEFTDGFDIPPKSPESLFANLNTPTSLRSAQHDNLESVEAKKRSPPAPSTRDEIEKLKTERSQRISERRRKAREKIAKWQPDVSQLHQLTDEELQTVYETAAQVDPGFENKEHGWIRELWGSSSSSSSSTSAYEDLILADSGDYYDWWSQGYRMLGGFIDCDNDKADDGSGDGNGGNSACSRWMMWAAYVNPNYQGGGYNEYQGYSYNDNYYSPVSQLDCHDSNSDWELLGIYRQEFYQFVEQISKHLWAIDDYNYVVALAALSYMTDDDCWYVDNSNGLYAGVQPLSGGNFQMSLYTDSSCIELDTSGANLDDYVSGSDMYLGSKDDGCINDDSLNTLYGYWTAAQEYTLTLVNEVYDQYKYCTLCMDYPTYQDGYFIGDSGTDDDDIINQCWKFHSHDSYTCTSDCVALGDAQGTIVQVQYGSSYGGSGGQSVSKSSGGSSSPSSKMAKFKANAFLTFNAILFVATFLAFSVARGSRADSRSSDKRKSLLSKDERARSGATDKSRSRSKKKKSRKVGGEDRSVKSKSSRRSKSNSRKKSREKKKYDY